MRNLKIGGAIFWGGSGGSLGPDKPVFDPLKRFQKNNPPRPLASGRVDVWLSSLSLPKNLEPRLQGRVYPPLTPPCWAGAGGLEKDRRRWIPPRDHSNPLKPGPGAAPASETRKPSPGLNDHPIAAVKLSIRLGFFFLALQF